jgi:outer membrane protein assembly factor BamD (BamD/ComL family)
MYKYNLKANPELAKERHAMQQREYYKRNKEYIIAMQRERRLTQRLMKRCLVAQETIPLNQALETLESLKQKGIL